MIETFKIVSNLVNYGTHLFRVSKSGYKLLKSDKDSSFLPNRIANYWNKVPPIVKDASTVNAFKARLENYKIQNLQNNETKGHYWELSDILLDKINDSTRDTYVNFMINNPVIAKIKKINIKSV